LPETLRYNRQRKPGRPPAQTLLPGDATILKAAAKAATRYYGIRQQDLGASIALAIRSRKPMSVKSAEQMYQACQQPQARLVKRKPAKGMSMIDAQAALEKYKEDPEANPLPKDPIFEYMERMYKAAVVVNNYARPQPGSTLFVIPGTSQRLAELLVESFVEEAPGVLGAESQHALVDLLSHYFKVAERPLRETANKHLLDKLIALGWLNRIDLTNELSKSVPREQLSDRELVVVALTAAENQRAETPNPKPAPPKRKPKPARRRRGE
jgi:hypothetical protein